MYVIQRTKMANLKKMTQKRQEIFDILTTTDISDLSDEFILSVPCDIYHNCLDDSKKEQVVDRVFQYYRIVGFPYYEMSDEDILDEYRKFINFNMSDLYIGNNELNQIMHGLNITNSFFPNMWSVKCKKMLTPKDVFDDDTKLKLAIRKRIKMSDSPLKPYNIRKSIKIFSGAQSVSGFRPSIAKFLVENLFDRNNITILDPCMGWGGRMFGFCVSGKTKKYVGFDVATETIQGLKKLKDKLIDLKLIGNTEIDIYQKPFEESAEILSSYDPFDFVMTSPPYFDIEKYSDDKDQSYLKHNTYNAWKEKFLRPLVQLSYDHLKDGGYIALNVNAGKLYDDTFKIVEEVFGKVDLVYNMRLSRLCGRGVDKSINKFKHEPIIISRKNASHLIKEVVVKRGRGRPKGSKNKKHEEPKNTVKRGRGRPKGSKNKPKLETLWDCL